MPFNKEDHILNKNLYLLKGRMERAKFSEATTGSVDRLSREQQTMNCVYCTACILLAKRQRQRHGTWYSTAYRCAI